MSPPANLVVPKSFSYLIQIIAYNRGAHGICQLCTANDRGLHRIGKVRVIGVCVRSSRSGRPATALLYDVIDDRFCAFGNLLIDF
jgi:hypothetical protein